MLNLSLRIGDRVTISRPKLTALTLTFLGFREGGFEVLWGGDQLKIAPLKPWVPTDAPDVSITLVQVDTARRIRASIKAPQEYRISRDDAPASQR